MVEAGWQRERDIASQAAREAGALLLDRLGAAGQVEFKSSVVDPVTAADRDSQALIADRLLTAFPDDLLLGEEDDARDTVAGDGRLWIVDPLDGTVNFVHGYPVFAVSIALYADGAVQVGVLYDPGRDEMFVATRGGGATLNGRPIAVSDTPTLIAAMVATGFPYDLEERRAVLPLFDTLVQRTQAVRRDGSAALNLAYVACGRFDAYWERNVQPWDIAAAELFLEEAGGRLTGYDGDAFSLWAGEVVASNGCIHDALLAVIASVAAE
ncbi:MAG TPA: inositol monophosphatase family protein [Thermomicrobiales bacterium]|nr:inositol monophosphatase [Chloroflexota bacterium]HQX61872.1 inositol monophosphatase family protein [Thermomicrobiales bacterium]HQZ89183.1 inositol monophosphatase family protein [Thermomicrobiales bacterium]HRA31101.1 inositol monophosphatase family protein [Thermomicrobiales bacterium]